MNAGCAAKLT